MLWYDGSTFPINKPQNDRNSGSAGGHHEKYSGDAPIFVTTKKKDMKEIETGADIDPETGDPKDPTCSMLYRRLKIYWYNVRAPKPPGTFLNCPHCFAHIVLNQQ